MTVASTVPPPCHHDPRLLDQAWPSPAEHFANERTVAAAVTAAMPRRLERVTPFAALARPRFYPPASRTAQWFADSWQYSTFSFLRALVLHTTETSGWPGYAGGGSAPNLTAMPDPATRTLVWRQHFGCDMSGRALVNAPGGVLTNTSNVLQVELVGTSAKGGPGLFWPDAPDWLLRELAKFVLWLRDNWGVSTASTVRWRSYPDSYGSSNGVRLAGADWLAYRGVLAHEHVPENDHGDTGLFPMARLQQQITALDGGDPDMLDANDKAYLEQLFAANRPFIAREVRDTLLRGGLTTADGKTVAVSDLLLDAADDPEVADVQRIVLQQVAAALATQQPALVKAVVDAVAPVVQAGNGQTPEQLRALVEGAVQRGISSLEFSPRPNTP